MKKLKLFLVATIAMLATSCSSNDDTSNVKSYVTITTMPYSLIFTSETEVFSPFPTIFHAKVDYLSNSNIIHSDAPDLSTSSTFKDEIGCSGDIIGIKVRLTDFDISNPNSGKGSRLKLIRLTIKNNSNNNLINVKYDIPDLQIGPAGILSTYEHTILYNTQTNTFSLTSLTHIF